MRSVAWLLLAATIVAWPSIANADCPGIPALCGMTCSPDAFGTPVYCSNGQCTCASGYDTKSGPNGIVCLPSQPEAIGTEARHKDLIDPKYSCPGFCSSDSDGRVGGAVLWPPVGNACQGGSESGSTCLSNADCVGTCGALNHGQCQGGMRDGLGCQVDADCMGNGAKCVAMGFCSGVGGQCATDADCAGQCLPVTYKPFDLVPVHGIAPGGEAFMPVWGNQVNQCGANGGATARCAGGSKDGSSCMTATDCPGGTCTLVGTCQGGSESGETCLSRNDCAGTCGPLNHGKCQGGMRDGLSCQVDADCEGNGAKCVEMGFCSGHGAECQTDADCGGLCLPIGGRCTNDGRACRTDGDCTNGATCSPIRSWAGCTPDPFPFCFGLQDSDEGDFDYDNCESTEGCGSCSDVDPNDWHPSRSGNSADFCGKCVSDFTDAWPYLDRSDICAAGVEFDVIAGTSDPGRIDFPNNVSVYRAPTRWEAFSDNFIDDDYTWDMESVGHEMYDTDTEFPYHANCPDETHGRVHIEFSSAESVHNFTDEDWGPANQFWRTLRCIAEPDFCQISNDQGDNNANCYVKSFVNPNLTCPTSANVDQDCTLHDVMAVVAGVPSIDCSDDAYQGTDEIHPVLGMALRIQEDPSKPEQWTFFYRQTGNTGPCGDTSYSRCLSTFKLPLGLPIVAGNGVLTGADVDIDWHPWTQFGGTPTDVAVTPSFDLSNGTVLNITLPHYYEGVVGLVTITPKLDTTKPQITCPDNVSKPVELGKCTAAVTFPAPMVSDNCSVSAACNPPSGSAFPIGTTTDTCTATDQAGNMASCSFNVTVTAGNRCPHNQGYWKNHANLWPVTSLTLGTLPYGKTQMLGILNNSTNGDASVILARSEIAALLSLANGSNPTPICGVIADANAALGSTMVPAKIGPKTALGQRMVGDANTLDSYSSGILTPGCTP
jgi:hypothetical protein